jgi:hypothetical protein
MNITLNAPSALDNSTADMPNSRKSTFSAIAPTNERWCQRWKRTWVNNVCLMYRRAAIPVNACAMPLR